jgi:hypothetical protein
MPYRIRQISPVEKFCEVVTVDMITTIVPLSTIREVIDECNAHEKRKRKLPSTLVILLCIAMNLYTSDSIDYVLTKLLNIPRLLMGRSIRVVANKGSISTARYRLGIPPLEMLFRRVCRPIATTDTAGAWIFGLRAVALDGTCEDVVDTPANAQHFEYPQGSHGPGAWPQTRCVYLCECGTHAIFDADVSPCYRGELPIGRELVRRSVTEDMLVFVDRGLSSYDMVKDIRQHGAHIAARVQSGFKLTPVRYLPDGSYLAHFSPRDYPRRKKERIMVRVVSYTLDDPARTGHGQPHRIMTTLLDYKRCPARQLVCAYHERWEVEITIDEIDTHQRLIDRPLRSRKPEGVRQEIFALLIAHYIVRVVMHQAALQAHIDPDRISFTNALRLIRDALPVFQIISPRCHNQLWTRLLADVRHFRLPQRDNRINPRVIKKRKNRFPRKRKHHEQWKQPTKTFQEAVVIL